MPTSKALTQHELFMLNHPELAKLSREEQDRYALRMYQIAKGHTKSIKKVEGKKAEIFMQVARQVFWFNHQKRFTHMGYGSLNEWADQEGMNASTMHYGVQVYDILFLFFDVPMSLLSQVGERKLGIIIPMCKQLRLDALEFKDAKLEVRQKKFMRCREAVLAWVQDAIDLGTTSLQDQKGVVKGWERVSPRKKWTKKELLYTPLLGADGKPVMDENGDVVMRERTGKEVMDAIGLNDAVEDDAPVRVNTFAPPLKRETPSSMVLGDDPEEEEEVDLSEEDDVFERGLSGLTEVDFTRIYQGDWTPDEG